MRLAPLLLIAAAFWGQTPACGQPTVGAEALPPPIVGEAEIADCSILVDPTRLSVPGSACMAILHEYGHLLGYYDPVGFLWPDGTVDHNHSPDPTNVMYAYLASPRWPCAW